MKISAKADYACRAILELALRWPNQTPVHMNTIAERQKIPIKFLMQIFLSLKQMGYVESIRGKAGGYRLLMPPKEILLSDVIKNFEGTSYIDQTGSNDHVLTDIWQNLEEKIFNEMRQLNFEIIAGQARKKEETLIFNI